ncbi:uncharacterized protein Z518_11212 [Rhinocladiella mackenziei CBS 650.93]|uniref:Copper-fist domain-containing protein n=1 Tax=Rhinocladiella mackenziei CBS 650.93 TaxID=1442369 RepID=A0A0D2I1A2_9EURO|nr:uncharacterized protein Z518_11212 [Rhinocladiella mackenziei CBS 650.93]KIW99473.1 hypothetical protein Z518_11212 [Rhinocladiella mackenziei CBS 650.93]
MHDRSNEKGATPPKSTARVEDGKIRKLKAASKSDSPAIQHFNGKTYACESCKRGHRVHKCDHGKTRPISETNQPGRPSGGQKRGCQCPRNCACTTKTCKCERDCACTQEMYLIVRLDSPQVINREATSTPKPVWEDAHGNKMTLKKVWADANGKEIDDEEYQDRKRRMKEREEGVASPPHVVQSPCCSSKKPKEEPESPPSISSGGCRHRQNVAAIQPHSDSLAPDPPPHQAKIANDPWMSACSCGSGCSCLYCPDHPNNATSINHTQQQVKHLAEHAYTGGEGLMPMSFVPDSSSTSCMGGRPSFFLSRTPGVSQQQLQRFFPENFDPNAIYLTYPIQQHSWTNQPVSAHCSHVHSPSGVMAATPETSDAYVDSLNDLSSQSIPWDLLPNDSNGTWNFSDGQLGDTSFSWIDLDASRGTDYSIGQATVASMSNESHFQELQVTTAQPTPSIELNLDPMTSPTILNGFPVLESSSFPTPAPQLDPQNAFLNLEVEGSHALPNHTVNAQSMPIDLGFSQQSALNGNPSSHADGESMQPPGVSEAQIFHQHGCGHQVTTWRITSLNGPMTPWNMYDSLTDDQVDSDLRGAAIPNSPPIANRG